MAVDEGKQGKRKKTLLECDVVWHDVLSARPDLVV